MTTEPQDEIDLSFQEWLESEDFTEDPYDNYVEGYIDGYVSSIGDSVLSDSEAVDILNNANMTLRSILEETTEDSINDSTVTLNCKHVKNIIELLNIFVMTYEDFDASEMDFKGYLSYNTTRH